MGNKTKKSESPACACGRGDLYEDWIKVNENKTDEVSDSTNSNQAGEADNSADDAGKADQNRLQTKE